MSRPAEPARICCIAGCGQPYCAKGLCRSHYDQRRLDRRKRQPRIPPGLAVVVCPDDLIPLVGRLADNDADRLFLVAWNWCARRRSGVPALRPVPR